MARKEGELTQLSEFFKRLALMEGLPGILCSDVILLQLHTCVDIKFGKPRLRRKKIIK